MEPARESGANDGRGDRMNLEQKLAKALQPLFDAIPCGTVREVDSVSGKHATIYIEDRNGCGETWLISFKIGEAFECVRIG